MFHCNRLTRLLLSTGIDFKGSNRLITEDTPLDMWAELTNIMLSDNYKSSPLQCHVDNVFILGIAYYLTTPQFGSSGVSTESYGMQDGQTLVPLRFKIYTFVYTNTEKALMQYEFGIRKEWMNSWTPAGHQSWHLQTKDATSSLMSLHKRYDFNAAKSLTS